MTAGRLRWCHLSATLGADYPWVAAMNSMPSFEHPSLEWYRGEDGPLHFFQTRVILQGWRRNSSVRNIIKSV